MRIVRQSRFIDDARAAYAWIAADSPRAADKLLKEIETLVEILGEFPAAGRLREDIGRGLHSFRLRRFRYVLFYRIEADRIVLLRLLHGARRAKHVDLG